MYVVVLQYSNLYCVTLYLASFLIGIMLALDNFKRLLDYFYAFDRRGIMIILLSVLIVMTCVLRQSSLRICGMLVDPFLAVEIICFYKLLNIKDCLFTKGLFFLGKHSMNIFLFHTFFLYYFKSEVYYFRNPVLIFFVFVVVQVIVSLGIEKLRQVIKL